MWADIKVCHKMLLNSLISMACNQYMMLSYACGTHSAKDNAAIRRFFFFFTALAIKDRKIQHMKYCEELYLI